MSVKLPSDIDMADRILWGLTARQLAILGLTCIVCSTLYLPLAHQPYVAAPLAVVAAAGVVLALARPDGVMAEQWLLQGLRHALTPRRRVLAPDGLPRLPQWIKSREAIAALELPVGSVGSAGVVVLGDGVFSLICRASALNLALRADSERAALVEGLGRFLNSIDSSLSFVVRSERSDLRGHIAAIERGAGALWHPALKQAAWDHAAFLDSLAQRRDILRREVYVVLSAKAQDESKAALRLLARAEEARSLLRGLGIRLTVLDGEGAATLIARALDP
ncbi:MAG: PrgI family protein, partial [Actinomycetota bacterium]|nr:PrgI family protein [Actinomycetota bacterium]